ncbi:protein translocase SEC61 complex subunit gamma [Candidatus Woesearchaeota archaeon]|nr:protein translocase SEC61 complex subunit gamma [Candidatus Woesearchaeota archaeon]|tara:strand:+ start:3356 stop:3547 length:192 start_codon:yes stop_codon:yes gene_type:complete
MDEEKPNLFFKLKRFVIECKRVLKVTKKPSNLEFKTIVKVSGLGMIIIGLIGFIVQMVKQLFF